MVRKRRRHTAALKFRVALEPLDRETWRLMRNGSDFLRDVPCRLFRTSLSPEDSFTGVKGFVAEGTRAPLDRILQGVFDRT